MSKRVLALFLTMLMLFSVNAVPFSATATETGNPTITLESKSAVAGDEDVSVAVSIDGNPGVWGMDVKISYDRSAMTLISVENGGFFQDSEWIRGNLNASTYTLSYEASGFDNVMTPAGTLAILHFKLNADAASGTYEIGATYRAGDFIIVSFDEIAFAVTNGSIVVREEEIPVTGIALDRTTVSIATADGAFTLVPTFYPQNATNKKVTWESSDISVATVTDGTVTPLRLGSTVITATTEDGGFSASCTVTVSCSHLNGTLRPAEASTCTKHGHGAYTVCNDCDVILDGSDAELPLLAHTYIEDVKANYLKSVATWDRRAVYYKSCAVCGEMGDETFEFGNLLPKPKDDSGFTLDREWGILYVPAACTADAVTDAFDQEVTVTKYMTDSEYVGTGSSVGNNDAMYYVVVLGDVNANGRLDSNDALLMRALILNRETALPDSRFQLAADMNRNGRTDSHDYILLRRFILGLS